GRSLASGCSATCSRDSDGLLPLRSGGSAASRSSSGLTSCDGPGELADSLVALRAQLAQASIEVRVGHSAEQKGPPIRLGLLLRDRRLLLRGEGPPGRALQALDVELHLRGQPAVEHLPDVHVVVDAGFDLLRLELAGDLVHDQRIELRVLALL